MGNSEKYMKLEDEYTLQTYARYPIVLESGDGVYVTDAEYTHPQASCIFRCYP